MSHTCTQNFVFISHRSLGLGLWSFCVHPLRSGAVFDFFSSFFKVIKKYLCKIAVVASLLSSTRSAVAARATRGSAHSLPPVCQERSVSLTPRLVGPASTTAVCAFSSRTVAPAACTTTQVSVTLRGTFFMLNEL